MGFFSSALGGLGSVFGGPAGGIIGSALGGVLGGAGGGQKTQVAATGFYSLPPELQKLYQGVLGQAKDVVLPGGKLNTGAFTPMPLGQGEQNALNNLSQGFTPTAESINKDLAMLMNPFDQYVVNDINRESQGANSLVNQFATQAGQMGSNRSFLGSSDVEQNRLNNIGQFRQGQYNQAINQILGPLLDSRRADASGALSGGTYARNLDYDTKQAPFNALNATTGALGQFGQGFQGTPGQTVKTGGGIGDILAGIQAGGNLGSQLQNLFGGANGFSSSPTDYRWMGGTFFG